MVVLNNMIVMFHKTIVLVMIMEVVLGGVCNKIAAVSYNRKVPEIIFYVIFSNLNSIIGQITPLLIITELNRLFRTYNLLLFMFVTQEQHMWM